MSLATAFLLLTFVAPYKLKTFAPLFSGVVTFVPCNFMSSQLKPSDPCKAWVTPLVEIKIRYKKLIYIKLFFLKRLYSITLDNKRYANDTLGPCSFNIPELYF